MSTMKLASIRDEFSGRYHQQLDTKNVSSLLSLLEAGQKFATNPVVTTDGVVIEGRHRIEAYRLFFAKSTKTPEAFDSASIAVDIRNIAWDKATDAQKSDLMLEGFKSNVHKKGKPADFDDIKHQVSRLLLDDELNEDQIIKRMQPEVGATQVKKAILAARERQRQIDLNAARQKVKEGMPVAKALKSVGLAPGTSLDVREVHDKVRANKIMKEARKTCDTWGRMYAKQKERFDSGSPQTQAAYLDVSAKMIAAAVVLARKADAIRKLTEEHITTNAKRIRSMVA